MKDTGIIYEIQGKSKDAWLNTAAYLKCAADILYRESEEGMQKVDAYLATQGSMSQFEFPEANVWRIARMLAGMALENLIKGILVQKDGDLIKDGKTGFQDHRLGALIEKIPFDINDKEKELLDELTKFIVWQGRFPISKRANDFKNHRLLEREGEAVNELFEKLYNELQRQ